MADNRIDVKAGEIFVLLQESGSDTKVKADFATATGLTTVVPTSDLAYTPNNPTNELLFGGDPTSRDGASWLTDRSAELSFKMFVPKLEFGVTYTELDTQTNPDFATILGFNIPMSRLYQMANANIMNGGLQTTPTAARYNIPDAAVSVPGTTIASWLTSHWHTATPADFESYVATNAVANSQLGSIYFQEESIDVPDNALVHIFTGCKANFDLDIEIGQPAMWSSVKAMGNYGKPTRETPLVPNYELEAEGTSQKLGISARAEPETIQICEIRPYGTAFESDTPTKLVAGVETALAVAGEMTAAERATMGGTGWKNICISKVTAPNFFGYKFDRQQMSCERSYSEVAESTDVTMTKLLGHVSDTYAEWDGVNDAPNVATAGVAANQWQEYIDTFTSEHHLENLEYFAFRFSYGNPKFGYLTFQWDKIQLMNVARSTVGQNKAEDLTFKNRGNCHVIWTPPSE